eukprot:jgi/Undpi1/13422/HiC_scaffold_8.g03081.m1
MKVASSGVVGLVLVLDGCWPRPSLTCSFVNVARRGCLPQPRARPPLSLGGLSLDDDNHVSQVEVCARDSRAEEEAHCNIDLDDDDEDLDSSGPGSDNDDIGGLGQRCGETSAAVTATAAGGGGSAAYGPTRLVHMTRSQTRSANGSVAVNGDGGAAGGGSGSVPVRCGGNARPAPAAAPNGLVVRVLADGEERDDDEAEGDVEVDVPGSLGPLGLAHKYPSFDTEGEEEDDEDEDDGGWGQVVVKPVKVARWDKQGQRSKHLLSLNQLRALIIARAESTPQKAIYRRAAKLGVFATVCLPALFTVCTMFAYAWVNAGAPCAADAVGGQAAAAAFEGSPLGGGVSGDGGNDVRESCVFDAGSEGCGRIELEALAMEALRRAARAVWALLLRAARPELGDGAAAAVSAISLCSVAFVALPAFHALEDAEQTYQRRYMYSKFFCALTSSQRARKHRLPYFSLKNVANIRVWLALRAGKTWLRRHRRERRADAVVSSAFFLCLALLAAILAEAISREARFLSTVIHWELLVWCCFISFFLLRYLTLGSNTNNRYRDTSVLLTEQINVQLRILQNSTNREASNKARKRERLGVSTNVLKLATKLLKELDGPNKLSGLSMNPVLYNVTRVVLVSALSGVMSDTLGFSVKLWKVISFK